MTAALIKAVKGLMGDKVDYMPHSLANAVVLYGVPPVPVRGLDYVFARYKHPQNRLVMSLNGKGVYVSNNNKSAIIEFGILNGTVTGAGVQIAELVGIPFPIILTDKTSGGTSTCIALSCRRVGTPEWRREKLPGVDIYTFETDRLLMSTGVRLPA